MSPRPPDIHNRLDRIAKALMDEAPRILMHIAGIEPLDAEIDVIPLRAETAPAAKFPDHIALIQVRAGGRRYIFHVEFQVVYSGDVPRRIARYGGSLAWQYEVEVISLLILLRADGVPGSLPEVGVYSVGRTRTEHPFQTVRLWDVDPGLILESNDPRVFPWVVLTKCSDEQVRRIGEMLTQQPDEDLVWRFAALGSLRYDRDWLESALGGLKVGLMEAILEGSSLVRHVTAKAEERAFTVGRTEGQKQGHKEGRREEALRLLRSVLAAKFPGLEFSPEIDRIESVEALESLLVGQIISATERDAVLRAIRSVAGSAAQ